MISSSSVRYAIVLTLKQLLAGIIVFENVLSITDNNSNDVDNIKS